jgi:outer membrane autotransporter protein
MVSPGTIAPGNSIDTLTIDGNVHNTGTLAIELGATSNDVIALTSGVAGVKSTFTFASGSTVDFTSDHITSLLPGAAFNFMTADSTAQIAIEGTPVSSHELLKSTDTLVDYKFFVTGNSGTLSSLSNLYAVVARDHAYEKFATTNSQSVVGVYLDGHRTDASFADLLLNLDLIPANADLNAALGLMSGELYPSLVTLENERVGEVLKSVAMNLRPLDTAKIATENATSAPRWYTFAQAAVASGKASDDKVADIDSSNNSVLAGVGCAVSPKWDIGGFFNAGDGKAENKHPDKADSSSFDLGAYARYSNAGDYYYASFGYSTSSFDVERQAAVARSHALISQAAVRTKGEFDSNQLSAYLEKGYTFEIGKSLVQPYAAFQYSKGSGDRFTETGDRLLDLTVDFKDFTSMRGILGASWSYEINRTFGVAVRGSWAHEFSDDVAFVDASFRGSSNSYHLRGLEMGSERFNAGLDLRVRLTSKLSACLRGDYTTSDGQEIESASIGFRYGW